MLGTRGKTLDAGSVLMPASIFRQNVENLPRASDQTFAKKAANQFFYNRAAESGKFFGYSGMGYGGVGEGFNTFVNWKEFTKPLYVVPFNQPTTRVWIVEEESTGEVGEKVLGPEETIKTGETARNIMKELVNVPLPLLADLPHGSIPAAGTDEECIVWQPSTDTLYEFHRLSQFKEGPHKGEWKCGNAHAQKEVSKWNGVCAPNTGNLSASKLSNAMAVIHTRDLVRIANGGEIGHSLGFSLPVRQNSHVAPATAHDFGPNNFPKLKDGSTPNPAFTTKGPEVLGDPEGSWKEGYADAVPEGSWFCFPKAARASEFGFAGNRFAVEFFEAGRKFGLHLHDGSGSPAFGIGDPRTMFTPYTDTPINPLTQSEFEEYVNIGTTSGQRKKFTASLPPWLSGALNGVGGALWEMPWRSLELLEPRVG